jgi:hypothetical protein
MMDQARIEKYISNKRKNIEFYRNRGLAGDYVSIYLEMLKLRKAQARLKEWHGLGEGAQDFYTLVMSGAAYELKTNEINGSDIVIANFETLPDWGETDPDEGQQGRQLAPTIFEFKDSQTDSKIIDLNRYSKDTINDILKSYDYEVPNVSPFIVAECIFESNFATPR